MAYRKTSRQDNGFTPIEILAEPDFSSIQRPFRQIGFTLIEILVVLIIIGLVSASMVLIGGDNRREILRDEAEWLIATLQLASEEAQLYGTELGLAFTDSDYRFVSFDDDRWQEIAGDKAYQRRALQEGLRFYLEIEGFPGTGGQIPGAKISDEGVVEAIKKEDEDDRPKPDPDDKSEPRPDEAKSESETKKNKEPETLLPQIFLLSSGEFNPFVLAIGSELPPAFFYRVRGTAEGNILLEGPLEGDLVNDLNQPWEDPRALVTSETP